MHKIDFALIKRTKFVRFDFELIVIRCSRLFVGEYFGSFAQR